MRRRNPILDRFFETEFRPGRFDPVGFCRTILDIEPHEGQRKWLRNSTQRENALTTGNRYGKSFGEGMKGIWRASYEKGWTADIIANTSRTGESWEGMAIAPSAKQSRLIFRAMRNLLKRSRKAQWLVAEEKQTPFPTITFFNGATISARSTAGNGERLLGEGLDWIAWDEAAREKHFKEIRDDVLKMRLAQRGGMLDYVTTGNGRNDYGLFFLDALAGKLPFVYAQSGRSSENPHWPPGEIERLRATLSKWAIRQNLDGEIIDAGNGFFSYEDLVAAINDDLTRQNVILSEDDQERVAHCELYHGFNDDPDFGPLAAGLPWHNKFPDHRYVHFWDIARKVDWVVGRTLDTSGKKLVCVEFERFQHKGWEYVYDRIRERHNRYKVAGISLDGPGTTSTTYVDATGLGDVVVEALRDIAAKPFVFTKPSKDEILTNLQSVLALREIETPEILVEFDELKFYERDDDELVQDTVMALAGAAFFGRRRKTTFKPFDF